MNKKNFKQKIQLKGIFKRCKKCKGYGYVEEFHEITWAIDEVTYSNYGGGAVYRKSRSICPNCEGTGQVTWVQHIMGK